MVTNLEQARILLASGWPSRTVTLLGPHRAAREGNTKPMLYSTGPSHLRMFMDDVTFIAKKWIPPTQKHIRKIIAHLEDIKTNENILIHCRAGISRSTAIAIALLVYNGATPKQAFKYVNKLSPAMDPNELILTHADNELGLNGALLDEYDVWSGSHRRYLMNCIPRPRESVRYVDQKSFWVDPKNSAGSLSGVTSHNVKTDRSLQDYWEWDGFVADDTIPYTLDVTRSR